MFRYTNDSCPVCGLSFNENDDIVVCPECGTPHHRKCYFANNGCVNTQKHGDGFVYRRNSSLNNDAPDRKCPNCGSAVPAGTSVCPNCRTDLDNIRTDDDKVTDNDGEEKDDIPFTIPGFETNIKDNELIKKVPAGDLKRYIGSMYVYYLPIFYNSEKGRRQFRLNFSAFAGSWIWLISRKMYLLGIISGLLTLISSLYTYVFSNVAVKALKITDEFIGFSDIISSGNGKLIFGYILYAVFSNLPFIMMVLLGIFGNKLYMNHCVNSVRKINRTSNNAEQFNKRLEKRGGVSIYLMFICFAIVIGFFILLSRGYISSLIDYLTNLILPYI